ncbi:AGAP009784-PA, partial [Anopheles gambiae str. PEST]
MANSEAILDTQTATQTQMTQDTALESQPIEHPSYGQLLGKHVKMKSLDLRHSEFKVGREGTCHLILDEDNLPPSKLCRISKHHFTIKKDLNDTTSPTYIHDHSRNGTYVNGRLIGPNKCMILKHNDIISIAGVSIRAFVYYDLRYSMQSDIKAKELLDRYHVGRKLGSGACGTVYLLHDTVSCQPYAMKHVAKDPLNERSRPKFLNDPLRVMNEVNIMKNLDHPCVIKMHDIVDKPDSVYMVLEYMKGGDLLSRIISKGFLPEKTAKLFFLQMCHAVKYLHEQGKLECCENTQRTISSLNVAGRKSTKSDRTLEGFVLLTFALPFGFCSHLSHVEKEVLQTGGRGSYTRKVDIWSLGVVLFTMLSGTLPFSDEYGSPAVEQIKRGNFKMRHSVWKQVSSLAKKLIYDILNVNPHSRPSIDTLLQSSWLRDPDIVGRAEQLMKISLRVEEAAPKRTTTSDVEN